MGFLGLLVLLAVGLTACGGDAPPPAPAILADDILTCDVTTAPCQAGIYESVAAFLEADGFGIPTIRTISVDEHAAEVRSWFDLEELTGEDPESRGLRLLGFLPPTVESLTEAEIESFINGTAAYYSPRARAITIIDRGYGPGQPVQVILAHEFVHAIQDSEFGNAVFGGAGTTDGGMAALSVTEGDAQYISYAWAYGLAGVPDARAALEEEIASWIQSSDRRVADPSVSVINAASFFPYAYGFRYMTDVTLDGGLDARDGQFLLKPTTAAEVLSGVAVPGLLLDLEGPVHPAPLDAAAAALEDRAGAWYVYIFLVREGLADEDAWAASQRWVGDELAIYEAGDEIAAVWRVRFADADSAEALNEQVNAAEGPIDRAAVLFGDDVYVFGAESAESLVAWADQPLDEMNATVLKLASSSSLGGRLSSGGCALPSGFGSLPPAPSRDP